jgi:hypothetical protein
MQFRSGDDAQLEPKAHPLGPRQPKRAEAVLMSPITITVTAGAPKDRAFVTVDGRTFEARSSAGAVFALCRKLVAASIPDRPYEVINIAAPGTVSLRGASIRAAAGLTVAERDRGGLTIERWTPPPTPRTGSPKRAGEVMAITLADDEPARVHEPVTA